MAEEKPIEIEIGCGKGRFLFERAKEHPEIRLRDYYVISELNLYGVLFAVSPKEKWEEYESLTTMIVNSLTFSMPGGGE